MKSIVIPAVALVMLFGLLGCTRIDEAQTPTAETVPRRDEHDGACDTCAGNSDTSPGSPGRHAGSFGPHIDSPATDAHEGAH